MARSVAASFCALVVVLAACSSSSSGGAPDTTFCSAATVAQKTCKEPTDCDSTLTEGCAKLDAVVSGSAMTVARDCLESGICGAVSCLSRSPKSAVPGAAHKKLAEDFCSSCAPDIADCRTTFYQRGKKLPGLTVLAYGDAVIEAIDAECTGRSGCQATFTQCVGDVTTRIAGEKLDAAVAGCVLGSLRGDTLETTGPGGPAEVARCTTANCTGCCRDDRCEQGATTSTCGANGAGCQICSGKQACVAGRCKEPCSPNNCAGCCDGDTCAAGTGTAQCGSAGEKCAACTGSFVCSNGQCIDSSCQATCTNGCCSAAGCQLGTSASACGTGGEACVDCGFGRSCTSGACVIDPNALWDFYVSFAVLPEKSKLGYNWDALAGLPDAYLVAFSSEGMSSHSGKTSTIADSFYPMWMETPLKGVKASELLNNLSFEIWDEDMLDIDDLIGGCELPVTAAIFDGSLQDYTCAPTTRSNSVQLYYRINPHK